jgi:hypothetical protein
MMNTDIRSKVKGDLKALVAEHGELAIVNLLADALVEMALEPDPAWAHRLISPAAMADELRSLVFRGSLGRRVAGGAQR